MTKKELENLDKNKGVWFKVLGEWKYGFITEINDKNCRIYWIDYDGQEYRDLISHSQVHEEKQ